MKCSFSLQYKKGKLTLLVNSVLLDVNKKKFKKTGVEVYCERIPETFKTREVKSSSQRCRKRLKKSMEHADDMCTYSCQYKAGENKLTKRERLNKVAVAKAIP